MITLTTSPGYTAGSVCVCVRVCVGVGVWVCGCVGVWVCGRWFVRKTVVTKIVVTSIIV